MNTVVLLILLFAIFGATAYVITIFNSLIALKTDIDKAWANIDVLLKQRHDELTKLAGKPKHVRIYGWMFFDEAHAGNGSKTWRGTEWEVHPITKIEVWNNGAWKTIE